MILKQLEVYAWRSILEKVCLGPFSEGLNLIHAPNGTGKSSLFEALQRCLFDSHQVKGRAMEEIRPWGRDLAPGVCVEFVHDGQHLRFCKQFLSQPAARLERMEEGRFRPLAEGRQADEYVRGLFSDQSPGRGLSKPEHMGLCQVLWAPQGRPELGTVAPAVVADVRQALGVQVSGTVGGPVEEAVSRRYFEFYTRTGKVKSGRNAPAAVRLARQLEELEKERDLLAGRYKELEQARLKVEDQRAARRQAADQEKRLLEEVARVKLRVKQYREIERKLERARSRADAAQAGYSALKDRIRQVDDTTSEIKNLEQETEQLRQKLEAACRQVELRRQEGADCRRHLEDLEKDRRDLEKKSRRLELARQYLQAVAELEKLTARQAEAEKCTRQLEDARRRRRELVAPDRKTLAGVRRAAARADKARAGVESFLIRLEIDLDKPRELEVIKGSRPEGGLPTSGQVVVSGPAEVVVELKGVGRIRARGPAGDLEKQARLLEKAEKELEELTRPFGTTDPERLQDLLDEAEKLDGQVKSRQQRLDLLLEDGDLSRLKARIGACRATVGRALEEFPGWQQESPDVEGLEKEYLEARSGLEQRQAGAEKRLEDALAGLAQAEGDHKALKAGLEAKQAEHRRAARRLEELGRDGLTQEQRREKLTRLSMEWEAASGPIEGLEKELAALGPDPARDLEDLERRLEAARGDARRARDREKTAEGELAQLARQDIYGQLAACDEKLAVLRRQAEAEKLRLEAVGLLYRTVEEFRNRTTAAVVRPLEKAACRLMERISGPVLEGIGLGEDLVPANVRPAAAGGPVGLENLSGGESEQLHLVCRLALAEVLARDRRQLVVLDDVLTATDTGRFGRILRILQEMAARLQIVILTCHPERYAGLEDMTRFDLEAALAG